MSYPQQPYGADPGQSGVDPYAATGLHQAVPGPPVGYPGYPGYPPPGPYSYPADPYGYQPGQPGWGGAYGYPYPPVRRPGTVVAGAVLTYIGAGFQLLVGLLLVALAAVDDVVDELAPDNPVVVVLVGAVVALVGLLLVVLAVAAQRGRNGARITLTVIGGLAIVLQLISFAMERAGGASAVSGLSSVVWIGLAVTLLWVGGANAWYRSVRAAR